MKLLTKDGKLLLVNGKIATDGCVDRCCGPCANARRYALCADQANLNCAQVPTSVFVCDPYLCDGDLPPTRIGVQQENELWVCYVPTTEVVPVTNIPVDTPLIPNNRVRCESTTEGCETCAGLPECDTVWVAAYPCGGHSVPLPTIYTTLASLQDRRRMFPDCSCYTLIVQFLGPLDGQNSGPPGAFCYRFSDGNPSFTVPIGRDPNTVNWAVIPEPNVNGLPAGCNRPCCVCLASPTSSDTCANVESLVKTTNCYTNWRTTGQACIDLPSATQCCCASSGSIRVEASGFFRSFARSSITGLVQTQNLVEWDGVASANIDNGVYSWSQQTIPRRSRFFNVDDQGVVFDVQDSVSAYEWSCGVPQPRFLFDAIGAGILRWCLCDPFVSNAITGGRPYQLEYFEDVQCASLLMSGVWTELSLPQEILASGPTRFIYQQYLKITRSYVGDCTGGCDPSETPLLDGNANLIRRAQVTKSCGKCGNPSRILPGFE